MTNEEINARVSAIIRNSLLPCSPALVEKWRLLARNIAQVESVDEGLEFIASAIVDAEYDGRELKWPEDYRPYAYKWRKERGPAYRKKKNNRTPSTPGGSDPRR